MIEHAPAATSPMLLRLRQAAKVLAVSERTLWGMSAPRGPIPIVRVGAKRRGIRYDVRDLRNWVDSQKGAAR